jgi:hypothetical protein
MRLIKIIIASPIIFIANCIALVGGNIGYFIGCFIGLIGGYIFTKAIDHDLEGLGWAIIGFPIYFLAMMPDTNTFLGGDLMGFTIRLMLSMLGLVLTFITFTSRRV